MLCSVCVCVFVTLALCPSVDTFQLEIIRTRNSFFSLNFFFERVVWGSRKIVDWNHTFCHLHRKIPLFIAHSFSTNSHSCSCSEKSNTTVMRFLWMCQPALNIQLSCQATEPGMNSWVSVKEFWFEGSENNLELILHALKWWLPL